VEGGEAEMGKIWVTVLDTMVDRVLVSIAMGVPLETAGSMGISGS
jgi:hypothetical protein